jgi:hypothetical protein
MSATTSRTDIVLRRVFRSWMIPCQMNGKRSRTLRLSLS